VCPRGAASLSKPPDDLPHSRCRRDLKVTVAELGRYEQNVPLLVHGEAGRNEVFTCARSSFLSSSRCRSGMHYRA